MPHARLAPLALAAFALAAAAPAAPGPDAGPGTPGLVDDLRRFLRAEPRVADVKVAVYVAHYSGGEPLADARSWVDDAVVSLTEIGGGATAYEAAGAWIDGDYALQSEPVTVVYTLTDEASLREKKDRLWQFLHRYGCGTRQDAVGLTVTDGTGTHYLRVPAADLACPEPPPARALGPAAAGTEPWYLRRDVDPLLEADEGGEDGAAAPVGSE